jgi:hypothetical protein
VTFPAAASLTTPAGSGAIGVASEAPEMAASTRPEIATANIVRSMLSSLDGAGADDRPKRPTRNRVPRSRSLWGSAQWPSRSPSPRFGASAFTGSLLARYGVERHHAAIGRAEDHGERIEFTEAVDEDVASDRERLHHEAGDQHWLRTETIGEHAQQQTAAQASQALNAVDANRCHRGHAAGKLGLGGSWTADRVKRGVV